MLGMFVGIFTPLPTLLLYYRWGRPLGYFIPGGSLVVGVVLFSTLGLADSIPYFMAMLALGLLLGSAMRQGWSVERTIGVTSLLVFGLGVLVFALTHGTEAGSVFKGLEGELNEAITATFKQYGANTVEKRLLEQALHDVAPLVVRLLPGTALASALVVCWLNLLVAGRYCRVHNLPMPPWEPWSRWKTPEFLVWPVIGCGFLLLVPGDLPTIVSMNALLVFGVVYLFQGLAVVSFYFERWHLPRILRAIIYGFLLLQQFITLGAILMGLFDVWFDFRRLSRKSVSNP